MVLRLCLPLKYRVVIYQVLLPATVFLYTFAEFSNVCEIILVEKSDLYVSLEKNSDLMPFVRCLENRTLTCVVLFIEFVGCTRFNETLFTFELRAFSSTSCPVYFFDCL
jgi:hypothetical protein